MADTLQPHLDKIASSSTAETAIFEEFRDVARGYALRLLSQPLRQAVGPTQIADSAIKSAIKAVRRRQDTIAAKDFRRLLFTIVRRKAAKAGRDVLPQGRDGQQIEAIGDRDIAAVDTSVADITENREIFERITSWILSEQDDTRRIIRYYGLIQEASANKIRQILAELAEQHPDLGFRLPAVRTIQLEIQQAQIEAKQRFDTTE